MRPIRGNLADAAAPPATGEHFAPIIDCRNVRIEQITSSATPAPDLYDQPQDEWVLLIEGRAVLELDGREIALGPGDWVLIPARTRHRVLATVPEPRCRWLAVHIHDPAQAAGSAP